MRLQVQHLANTNVLARCGGYSIRTTAAGCATDLTTPSEEIWSLETQALQILDF